LPDENHIKSYNRLWWRPRRAHLMQL